MESGEGTANAEDGGEARSAPAQEIDLDACELDALRVFLDSNGDVLRRCADASPRRVVPKAYRTPGRLARALAESWAWPECRAHLVRHMLATRVWSTLRREGFEALPRLLASFPPNPLVWYAAQAGLQPDEVLAALGGEGRDLFAERQRLLRRLAEYLRERREERYATADEARARAAHAEAKRLTRQLRWRADQAEDKLPRAEAHVEAVARDREGVARRLEGELAEARQRNAWLEAENAELRASLEEAGRAHHEAVAALSRQVRELAAAREPEVPPLAGEHVVVVGDAGHREAYERVVEELGGTFAFHPGFEVGPRLEGALASATLVVYVAAYAAHKTQDHVRRAERRGVPVIVVPVAGGEAFRQAVLGWCDRRGGHPAEGVPASAR